MKKEDINRLTYTAIVMLGIALFPITYPFYKILRVLICCLCTYLTYVYYKKANEINYTVITFGVLAMIFNPIYPLNLGSTLWKIVDIITIAILYLVVIIEFNLSSLKQKLYSADTNEEDIKSFYNSEIFNGKENLESHITKIYYDNGKLKSEAVFENNMLNGFYKEYYPNGNLKLIGAYKDDKKDGKFIEYSLAGKLVSEIVYKSDIPQSTKIYEVHTPAKKMYASTNKLSDFLFSNPFSFSGRIGRKVFAQAFFIITFLDFILVEISVAMRRNETAEVLCYIVMFLLSIKFLQLLCKRFHDIDASGFCVILMIILSQSVRILAKNVSDLSVPIIIALIFIANAFLFILFFRRGTKGKNQYGEDPLNNNQPEETK